VAGRIIDLSRAAARALDMLGPGTARVRITVLKSGSKRSDAMPAGAVLAELTSKDTAGEDWIARIVPPDEDPGSAAHRPAHNK
jgi:rare lipoprotein A (peptidoglycan hydrolase)